MNLCDQYKLMHEQGAFKGYSLLPHVEDIAKLVKQYDAKTLLDYGCGKGLQYTEKKAHEAWGGIMPTLYDPHVRGFDSYLHERDPQILMFDGVICTDVLEHIDDSSECDVYMVLKTLFNHAEKFIFLTICTRPAKKNLPDGRNCHLTVQSKEWWLQKMKQMVTSMQQNISWVDDNGVLSPIIDKPKLYVKFVE